MRGIIDMHCDTISALYDKEKAGELVSLRENTGHVDLCRMKSSGYILQNFALFVEKEKNRNPWERVLELAEFYREQLKQNRDMIAPVFCYGDIAANEAAGKLSALLTVEEGGVCGGEMEKLHTLYALGVRMLTLTWNYPNELGFPHHYRAEESFKGTGNFREIKKETENAGSGLTKKGREFVVEMERMGMIPDVSHLSDAGFYDVLALTRKPFVASHSNARSVCAHSRNLTDDMIRRLAERGGCMGLNFYTRFLADSAGKEKPDYLAAALEHAKHIVKVGGIEVLGLGSDFDGIDTNEALPGAQSMGILWDTLKGASFTESQLDKIFCGNVLRVYRECL